MKIKFVLNKDFGVNTEIYSRWFEFLNIKTKKVKYFTIIYYFIDDSLEGKKDKSRALAFEVEVLYLIEKECIKIDEDIRSALAKISRYCRKNNEYYLKLTSLLRYK